MGQTGRSTQPNRWNDDRVGASGLGAPVPLRMPGTFPNLSPRGAAPSRPHLRPTPTFSFAEELALESARSQDRRARASRSGGGVLLLFLMLLAGSAGYVAVKYRVWQDTGPLVERAKELGRSLRTLAPGASPEVPASRAPAAAPAPTHFAPEVVPITRAPEAAPASGDGAARAHHAAKPH